MRTRAAAVLQLCTIHYTNTLILLLAPRPTIIRQNSACGSVSVGGVIPLKRPTRRRYTSCIDKRRRDTLCCSAAIHDYNNFFTTITARSGAPEAHPTNQCVYVLVFPPKRGNITPATFTLASKSGAFAIGLEPAIIYDSLLITILLAPCPTLIRQTSACVGVFPPNAATLHQLHWHARAHRRAAAVPAIYDSLLLILLALSARRSSDKPVRVWVFPPKRGDITPATLARESGASAIGHEPARVRELGARGHVVSEPHVVGGLNKKKWKGKGFQFR